MRYRESYSTVVWLREIRKLKGAREKSMVAEKGHSKLVISS